METSFFWSYTWLIGGACGIAEHLDSASLELLDVLVKDVANHACFILVAVRSSEGVTDDTMRAWLELPGKVTHQIEIGRCDVPPALVCFISD